MPEKAYMKCPRCGSVWKTKKRKGGLTAPLCGCGAAGVEQPKDKIPKIHTVNDVETEIEK